MRGSNNTSPSDAGDFSCKYGGCGCGREDRTSLAFSLHANAPGALLQALEIFAARGLNMSRIESRPSKRELGEYVFFVDLEAAGPPVDEVCAALQPLCERLSSFGSYPITDDTVSP